MAKKVNKKKDVVVEYVKVRLTEDKNFLNLGKQPVVGEPGKLRNLWFSRKKYAERADGSVPNERVVVRTPKVESYIQGDLLKVIDDDPVVSVDKSSDD